MTATDVTEVVINSEQYQAIMQALDEIADNQATINTTLSDIVVSLHYITYILLLFVIIWVFGKTLYHMFVEPCDG